MCSKNWLAWVVAAALVGLAAPALALDSGQKVTLTHYKFNSRADQVAILQKLADQFHQEHPNITINIITGPEGPEYEDKVKVMLAGGNPPDITEFYTTLASSMAEARQFLDLRPYVAKDPRWQAMEMTQGALDGSTWTDGTLFTMPSLIGGNILAYNGGLLADAGYPHPYDMGNQWNWDTMLSMVKTIARDANADGTPEVWGDMGRVQIARVLTFMQQAGAIPFDAYYAPRSANFMQTGVRAGARFAADLLNPAVGTTNYNRFIEGKAGFCWIGIFPFSVELARLRMQPNALDFRVSPWPLGPAGNRGTVTEVRGWQIMKDSKYKDEAWEWLSFVHLNNENALAYSNVHGWIPASRRLQGAWLNQLAFSGVEKQMVQIAIQSTQEAANIPTPAGPGVLDVTKYWDANFANVVNSKIPLDQFLETMNAQARELLKR